MATSTTTTAAKAFAPDVIASPAVDALPLALFHRVGTHVGDVDSDAPAVRVPYAPDVDSAITAEAAAITEQDATLAETTITTKKLASLVTISNELAAQPHALEQVIAAQARGITKDANDYFLNDPTAGILTGLTAGTLAGLGSLAAAVATIEEAYGNADRLVMAPSTFVALATEIGLGNVAPDRVLLGIPAIVSPSMPAGSVLVADSTAIMYVSGDLRTAMSDQSAFGNDASQTRSTLRIGQKVARADRLVLLASDEG